MRPVPGPAVSYCGGSARGRSPFRGSLVVVAWSFPPPGPGLVALLPGGSAGGVSPLVQALVLFAAWVVGSVFGFGLRSGFVARCPARSSAPWVRGRPPASVSVGGRRGAGPEGWVVPGTCRASGPVKGRPLPRPPTRPMEAGQDANGQGRSPCPLALWAWPSTVLAGHRSGGSHEWMPPIRCPGRTFDSPKKVKSPPSSIGRVGSRRWSALTSVLPFWVVGRARQRDPFRGSRPYLDTIETPTAKTLGTKHNNYSHLGLKNAPPDGIM